MSQATTKTAAPERPDLSKLVEQTVQESRALVASHAGEIEPVHTRVVTADPQATLFRALSVMTQADELLSAQQARIAQLEGMLMQDEMTGLLNRRGLEYQFVREAGRIKRKQSRGCTLAVFDLDKFKEINDTHGHPAGDAALRLVGDFFLRTVRTTDAIARIGGDEFALLLTDIYPDMGNRRAAGVAGALNNLVLDWNGASVDIKTSVGAARCLPDEPFDSLYQQADVALYAAKTRRK